MGFQFLRMKPDGTSEVSRSSMTMEKFEAAKEKNAQKSPEEKEKWAKMLRELEQMEADLRAMKRQERAGQNKA